MVLTNAQTTEFFTQANQMALPDRTRTQLAVEGITAVDDLGEFHKDDFKQLLANLASPPATLGPAPAGGGAPPLIPTAPFTLGAKSLRRLKVAANAVRYYEAIDRPLTAGMMHYSNCLTHFELQWNALVQREDDDQPDVPKITRNLKVTKWSESFSDFLHRVNGVRHAPLAYVIRANEVVAAPAPALAHQRPYSNEHGSVEGELIARLSHASPIFRDDNSKVYSFLEEATRGTSYSSSLKPYQRTKNGRAAFQAILNQHAGIDKWERELKAQENFMKTRVWKGNSNFSLDKFTDQHRSSFISMQQCSEHVPFQLPNEYTRIGYLLDAIKNSDPELQASMAAIRMDTVGPDAKRNNFENTVAFLLPSDPVARRRKDNDRASVSETNANISALDNTGKGAKVSVGKTGVALRFYKKSEYRKLTDEQKLELKEWRAEQQKKNKESPSASDNGGPSTKKFKRQVASAVKEELDKQMKKEKEEKDKLGEIKEVVMTLLQSSDGAKGKASAASVAAAKTQATLDTTASAMAQKLQSIVSRTKSE